MRWITVLLLLFSAAAQSATPTYDCISKACMFVADPYPTTGPVPASCKLYSAGVVKATAIAVQVSSGVQCQVPAVFAAGQYSVTMSAVDGAGVETAQSVPFVFVSGVPISLSPPTNVHIQ